MNKNNKKEILTITESPGRRPYAAKISFILGGGDKFAFDGEASLLIDKALIVKIKPEKNESYIDGEKLQKLTGTIEGFSSACEAENMGLKLSLAILWISVSKKWPLQLIYHTPQPCMVYDRTVSSGLRLSGSVYAYLTSPAKTFAELIDQIISRDFVVDKNLLLSMEMFASARMERTERAKFIGLVSALEPLSQINSYEDENLNNIINEFLDKLGSLKSLNKSIRASVITRATQLGSESISQSIHRLVKEHIPENKEAPQKIYEAYTIRSRILHTGSFDADLDKKSQDIEDIIRSIYSRIIGEELMAPATGIK